MPKRGCAAQGGTVKNHFLVLVDEQAKAERGGDGVGMEAEGCCSVGRWDASATECQTKTNCLVQVSLNLALTVQFTWVSSQWWWHHSSGAVTVPSHRFW